MDASFVPQFQHETADLGYQRRDPRLTRGVHPAVGAIILLLSRILPTLELNLRVSGGIMYNGRRNSTSKLDSSCSLFPFPLASGDSFSRFAPSHDPGFSEQDSPSCPSNTFV